VFPPDGIAVIGDEVVAAYETGVTAYALSDGQPRWTVAADGGRAASGDGDLVAYYDVAATNTEVTALDAATGRLRWRARLPAPPAARPAFVDGDVLVVDAAGGLNRLRRDDGTTRYRVDLGCATCGSDTGSASQPTIAGGTVILGAGTDVVAVRPADGAIAWRHHTTAPISGSPMPAGANRVVIPIRSPPSLLELNASDGMAQTVPLPAEPGLRALSTGTLIITSAADGRIHAIKKLRR
jgi:outer membrane protein assembly factor BamB